MKQHRNLWVLSLVVLMAILTGRQDAAGAPPAPPKASEEFPINITAAHLEAEHSKQEITFRGQVVARYKDMILYCDALKIYYETQKQAAPAAKPAPAGAAVPESQSPLGGLGIDKLSRIVAQGHVRMVQDDKVASGDTATYYKAEDKVVLIGNPQLWRGESNLKGDKITFYLGDNRAVVDGAPQKRVEAVLYPGGKTRLPGKDKATPAPSR